MSGITVYILFHVLCGFAAAGFVFGHCQGEFPGVSGLEDLGMSLLYGLLFGPLTLFISFFLTGFWHYGWRLWRK